MKFKSILSETKHRKRINIIKELAQFKEEYRIPSLNLQVVDFEKDGSKGVVKFQWNRGKIKNNTPFLAQSVSKTHVKVLILKLVELGKIDLDAPILDWLDPTKDGKNVINYYDWNAWSNITVRDCLLHKSGIPDFMNEIDDFASYNPDAPKSFGWVDVMRALSQYPLYFEAGKEELYSNSNFYILTTIAELTMKKRWYQLLEEYIFAPAGCRNSGRVDYRKPEVRKMIGFIIDETGNMERGNLWTNSLSKGLIYTTVTDLHLFSKALLAGRIISVKLLKEWFDDQDNPIGQLGAGDSGSIVYYNLEMSSGKSTVFVTDLFSDKLFDEIIEIGDKANEI
jgi:CubicO group peptidase (beta-lactamase class C family)